MLEEGEKKNKKIRRKYRRTMSKTVIAKFYCDRISQTINGAEIDMMPVTSGCPENEEFFKWTPYGKLTMGVVNPDVVFEVGADYYLEFKKA